MTAASDTGSHLPPLLRALADPALHGLADDDVQVRETHASWVVLAGDRAWKVKKPIAFAFLDQRTPQRRRAACEAELELNRPLAPDLYLAVRGLVPASEGSGGAGGAGGGGADADGAGESGTDESGADAGADGAGESGADAPETGADAAETGAGADRAPAVTLADADHPDAAEYAVEMRRFDERETLAGLIADDALETRHLRAVAERLADFHAQAPLAPPADAPHDTPAAAAAALERLNRNGEELIALLDEGGAARPPAAGSTAGVARAAPAHPRAAGSTAGAARAAPAQPRAAAARSAVLAQLRASAAFAVGRAELLAERARAGKVREVHGDLRAEHVLPGPPVRLVDRLEFNRAWREVDVADELAFLAMDLTALGRPDAVATLLAAYRGAGGDPGDAGLLAFHAVYRAHVRAKVSLLRAAQERDDGEEEAAAAERERSAALLAVAERYAWRLRLPPALVVCGPSASGKSVLAAEIGRRAGVAPTERAGQAVYDEAMNARTYEALGRAAAEAVAAGEPAIVDATFRRRPDRDAFARGWEEARAVAIARRDPPAAPAADAAAAAAARAPAAEAVAYVELTASPELLRARARRRLDDPERVSDGTPELALAQLAAFEPLSEIAPARHHLLRADRPPAQLADALAAALDGLLADPPSA